MLALLGTHLAGMGASLTLPVLSPLIAAETGLPASLAGVDTTLVYAGALLSGPMAQGLLRRHGGIRVSQGCLPGIAVVALAVVLGATAVAWQGMLLAKIARVAPPGRVGAATAAMGFAFAVTMLFAPSLFSALVGLTGGYAAGFGLCPAAALLPLLGLRGAAAAAACPR